MAVVAHAYRVHAERLRFLEAAADRGAVRRRAERAEVLVEAASSYLHAPPGQLEAARVGEEADRADAVAVGVALHVHRVEVRIVDVPEARVRDRERILLLAALRHFVDDLDGRGLLADGWRCDGDSARHHVVGGKCLQPAAAHEPEARVPAGEVRRTVRAHGQHVLRAVALQVWREVNAPAGVAERPAADEPAVDPHHRICHRAVADEMREAVRVERERLSLGVQPRPVGREPATVPRRACGGQVPVEMRQVVGEGEAYRRVVRNAHALPLRVVVVRLVELAEHDGFRAARAARWAWHLHEVVPHVVKPVGHVRKREGAPGRQRLVGRE